MVRVKPAPEQLLSNGRITMRETTREIIHELSVGDDERTGRGRRHVENASPLGYSVEYPHSPPPRQDNREIYEQYSRQQLDRGLSDTYDGPNEYMSDQRNITRKLDNQRPRNEGDQYKNPSFTRMQANGNEYMTDERQYTGRSTQNEQHSRRQFDPSNSRNFDGSNEYMTSEQSYAKPTNNRSRQFDGRENINPSLLGINASRNEYMTGDQHNSNRAKQVYRELQRQERAQLRQRQINEYMTEQQDPNWLEIPRDSFRLEPMALRSPEREQYLREQLFKRPTVREERNRGRTGLAVFHEDTERGQQLLQHPYNVPNPRQNHQNMSRVDKSLRIAAGSSRRSVDSPRFRSKFVARKPTRKHCRPGAKVLVEIRRLQKSVCNLIPKAPLLRLAREVVQELYPQNEYRFTTESLEALREAAEAHLTQLFCDANSCATHAARVTVMPRDFHLARDLQRW